MPHSVSDLSPEEYGTFYRGYLDLVPRGYDLRQALTESGRDLANYLRTLPPERADYRYAPGKWTVREALQHVCDTERIFSVRALRLGRHDPTPQPGFDQDVYAATVSVTDRALSDLVEELDVLRRGTLALAAGLRPADLQFTGTVSGYPMSCRAMLFIAAGHTYHHLKVYRERYTGPS